MEAPGLPAPVPALRVPEALAPLRDSRVDLIGVASVEGGEMARYLLAAGFNHLVGHDQQPDLASLERAHHLAHAGLGPDERRQRLQLLLEGLHTLQLGDRYLEGVGQSAVVIPTQAWFLASVNVPLQRLRDQGHPFYSLVQAYLDLARGEVVGITGSHGKSTTSALVAAVLSQAEGFQAIWLAGNDRHNRQALEEVARDPGGGCLVLEISNRQLLQMDRAPRVACITNITPNHLEEHGGMAGYVRTKHRIFDLPGCEVAVRNGDDPLSFEGDGLREDVQELRFARTRARLGGLDGVFAAGGELCLSWEGAVRVVMPVGRVWLRGEHNLDNVRAALSVVAGLRLPDEGLLSRAASAVESFGPLRHRTEVITEQAGVEYVDDLSSTTPQSTVAAIRALERPCVLIAGGQDKGIDFADLVELADGQLRAVLLLPGAGSDRLAGALAAAGHGSKLHRVERLQEAVGLARELAHPGDAVLLSPACPGFFSAHYREGGFRRAVRRATSPRPRTAPA